MPIRAASGYRTLLEGKADQERNDIRAFARLGIPARAINPLEFAQL